MSKNFPRAEQLTGDSMAEKLRILSGGREELTPTELTAFSVAALMDTINKQADIINLMGRQLEVLMHDKEMKRGTL